MKNPDKVKNSAEYTQARSHLAHSAGVEYNPVQTKKAAHIINPQSDMHTVRLDDEEPRKAHKAKDKLKKSFPKTAKFIADQKTKREEKRAEKPKKATSSPGLRGLFKPKPEKSASDQPPRSRFGKKKK